MNSHKPVALLIAGEPKNLGGKPSRIQPWVSNEINAIDAVLKNKGYEICRVESGTLEELRQKLSDPYLRHRIVIVHYAGHSDADNLLLNSAEGREAKLSPEEFRVQLADAPNISLIFLNGCENFPQMERYYAVDVGGKDFAFLGNKAPISSPAAAYFAECFYRELSDGLSIFNAINRAKGNLSQEHKEVELLNIYNKYGLQANFTLNDGHAVIHNSIYSDARKVGFPSIFSKYLFVVILLAAASAFAAHSEVLRLSSPAFQSAFSIKPNDVFRLLIDTNGMQIAAVKAEADLNLLNEIYGSNPPGGLLAHVAKSCDANGPIDEKVRARIRTELRGVSARHGYLVEIARSVLLAATLGLFFAYCSTEVGVPRGWPLLTYGEFLPVARTFFGFAIIALAVLGSVFLVYYHASIGPAKLSEWGVGDRAWTERRWTLLHCFDEVWQNAWGSLDGKWQNFMEIGDGSAAAAGSVSPWRMYTLPYLLYLPYSFINFVGLLIPILYLVVMFVRTGQFWLTNASESASARLKALLVKGGEKEVDERRSELVARLTHVNRLGRRFVGGFAWLLLVLAVVEIFEAVIGVDTLAAMARIWAIIAVAILAAASALFALLYTNLNGQRNRIYDLAIVQQIPLPDDVRQSIDRLPAIFSRTTMVVLLLAVAGIAASTFAIVAGVT